MYARWWYNRTNATTKVRRQPHCTSGCACLLNLSLSPCTNLLRYAIRIELVLSMALRWHAGETWHYSKRSRVLGVSTSIPRAGNPIRTAFASLLIWISEGGLCLLLVQYSWQLGNFAPIYSQHRWCTERDLNWSALMDIHPLFVSFEGELSHSAWNGIFYDLLSYGRTEPTIHQITHPSVDVNPSFPARKPKAISTTYIEVARGVTVQWLGTGVSLLGDIPSRPEPQNENVTHFYQS